MNIIRKCRKKNGLTQRQLAIKLNVKQSYISELENSNKLPSIDLVFKLANIWNICPLDLINELMKCCNNCRLDCHIQNTGNTKK